MEANPNSTPRRASGGRAFAGGCSSPGLEPVDHPSRPQRRALSVQQRIRSRQIAHQRHLAVTAGHEHPTGVQRDREHVVIPVAVERLQPGVVVRAAVEQMGHASARARKLDLVELHRRECSRHRRRRGDRLRNSQTGAGRRCEADDVVTDDITFEPEPRPGREVGGVEDPPAARIQVLELDVVEQPVVERPRQNVGPVPFDRSPARCCGPASTSASARSPVWRAARSPTRRTPRR